MRIIDRYLLRQFIKSFLVFFVSLTGLYIVIDAFGNLDEFIGYGEQQGSLLAVLMEYYGARALTFFDLTSGVLMLVAAMFTVTWLQRSQEMTALMAAGISKGRIVAPILVAVAVISGLAALNRELLIPRYQDKLSRNAQDWLGENARPVHPRYDIETDIYIGGMHTYAHEMRIEKPNFLLPPRLAEFGSRLIAENAYYRPPEFGRPGGYLLCGVTQPEALEDRSNILDGQKAVILMPKQTSWLEPDQCFVVSQLAFEHLEGGATWRRYSSTWDLIRGLRNPSVGFGPDVKVTIHSRFVQPILDMALLFLGLPLVLTREQRNVFSAIAMGGFVVGAFFSVVITCHALGTNYLLSPALAAWCPLMILVPLAVWMAEPLRE
jgi:lipopolysaccharide export system permease protein